MSKHTRTLIVSLASLATAALAFAPVVRTQSAPRAPRYAITGAKIVTNTGAPIDKGTIVLRDGVIEDVGASVTAPADAMVIDGTGLTVYPGLIDMSNSNVVQPPSPETSTANRSPFTAAGTSTSGKSGKLAFGSALVVLATAARKEASSCGSQFFCTE